MDHRDELLQNEFNPTFLFTWKGVRTKDEVYYHNHDYLEMALIMSGRGKYLIDGVVYDIEEGDLLILNPGVYHQAISEPSSPATEFFIGANDFCIEGMRPNCLDLKSGPIYKTGAELRQKLMRLCIAMSGEREAKLVGRYYMMQSYLTQFLLHVLRDEHEPVNSQNQYSFDSINKNEIVSQIIEYFEQHYAEKISLDIISGNMYVSPFYISKIFKSVTGDTPIRYLIDIRLTKAKELLEQYPEMSIHEAASRVGYDDAYHFSKLFKKRFGTSPSGVRVKE